jgi:hypothetical protein
VKPIKQLLRPERQRLLPEQFSWVDQALVQQHFIDRCAARSAALYLFLITVSDAQGLSYYGTATLARRLHLSDEQSAQGEPGKLNALHHWRTTGPGSSRPTATRCG